RYEGPGELILIDGNLNLEEWINILEASLLPSVRAYSIPEPLPIRLAQNRFPIHSSQAIANRPEIRVNRLPPPTLNPTENFWGLMKKQKRIPDSV
ncbi:hypothetical protein Hamer_G004439, partial [Homarus americanus]